MKILKQIRVLIFLLAAFSVSAANVRIWFVNPWTGLNDTNYFTAWQVSSNVLSNGGVVGIGNPIRIQPGTNGLATNYFYLGHYAISDPALNTGNIGINVYDTSQAQYDWTNLLFGGFNNYVTIIYGSNPPPSLQSLTNVLGGLPILAVSPTNGASTNIGVVFFYDTNYDGGGSGAAALSYAVAVSNQVVSASNALASAIGLAQSYGVSVSNNVVVASNALAGAISAQNAYTLGVSNNVIYEHAYALSLSNQVVSASNALVAAISAQNAYTLGVSNQMFNLTGFANSISNYLYSSSNANYAAAGAALTYATGVSNNVVNAQTYATGVSNNVVNEHAYALSISNQVVTASNALVAAVGLAQTYAMGVSNNVINEHAYALSISNQVVTASNALVAAAGLVQVYCAGVSNNVVSISNLVQYAQSQTGCNTNFIVVTGGTGSYAAANGTDVLAGATSWTNLAGAATAYITNGPFGSQIYVAATAMLGAAGGWPVGSTWTNIAGSGTAPTTAFMVKQDVAGANITISNVYAQHIFSSSGSGSGGISNVAATNAATFISGSTLYVQTNYDAGGAAALALAYAQSVSNNVVTTSNAQAAALALVQTYATGVSNNVYALTVFGYALSNALTSASNTLAAGTANVQTYATGVSNNVVTEHNYAVAVSNFFLNAVAAQQTYTLGVSNQMINLTSYFYGQSLLAISGASNVLANVIGGVNGSLAVQIASVNAAIVSTNAATLAALVSTNGQILSSLGGVIISSNSLLGGNIVASNALAELAATNAIVWAKSAAQGWSNAVICMANFGSGGVNEFYWPVSPNLFLGTNGIWYGLSGVNWVSSTSSGFQTASNYYSSSVGIVNSSGSVGALGTGSYGQVFWTNAPKSAGEILEISNILQQVASAGLNAATAGTATNASGTGTAASTVASQTFSGTNNFTNLANSFFGSFGSTTNVWYVDVNCGNDAGATNRFGVPYYHIAVAASNAENAYLATGEPQVVQIAPGTYQENQILYNDVILNCAPNAVTISNYCNDSVSNSWLPIASDLNGAGNFYIFGNPNIVWAVGTNFGNFSTTNTASFSYHPTTMGSTNTGWNQTSAIEFTNPSSYYDLNLGTVSGYEYQYKSATSQGLDEQNYLIQLINGNNGIINANQFIDAANGGVLYFTNSHGTSSSYVAYLTGFLAWVQGDATVNVNFCGPTTNYAVWNQYPPSAAIPPTNNFFFNCNHCESRIYTSDTGTNSQFYGNTWRNWFTIGWEDYILPNYSALDFYAGKNYVTSQKVSALNLNAGVGVIAVVNTPSFTNGTEVPIAYLSIQLIEGNAGYINNFGGFIDGTVGDMEQGGNVLSNTPGISDSTTAYPPTTRLSGHHIMTETGIPVEHTGGTNTLTGFTIDTVGGTNQTVVAYTNGLTLQNCIVSGPGILCTSPSTITVLGGYLQQEPINPSTVVGNYTGTNYTSFNGGNPQYQFVNTNLTAATSLSYVWPIPYADTNYQAVLLGDGTAIASVVQTSKTTTSVTFTMTAFTGEATLSASH
jgi:hypothetical protein